MKAPCPTLTCVRRNLPDDGGLDCGWHDVGVGTFYPEVRQPSLFRYLAIGGMDGGERLWSPWA